MGGVECCGHGAVNFGQRQGVAEWVVCSVADTQPSILDRSTEWRSGWCVVLWTRSRPFWTEARSCGVCGVVDTEPSIFGQKHGVVVFSVMDTEPSILCRSTE